jgi:glycerol-3-phosphate dehydrogenase (NAD(P)+)
MDLFKKYLDELIINNEILVIGAGGWGTAISNVLAENKFKVKLWAFEEETVANINIKHCNSTYLPKVQLNHNISAFSDIHIIEDQNFFISAIPTQFIRATFNNNKINLTNKKVLNLAKGIEVNSLLRCSEIFYELNVNADDYAILTGPSHAEEVGLQQPTTVVTSSEEIGFARFIQILLSNNYFRVYTSQDIVGCELGGSVKNVIAIAAGIIDGLQFGDNTKAALITRGLAEMTRLSVALGANSLTLSGLSGLGDLIVTCNSQHSRNRKIGELIGQGKSLNNIIKQMQMVAEGIETTKSTFALAKKHDVDMPIVEKVYQILFENLNPTDALNQLMTRKFRHELW